MRKPVRQATPQPWQPAPYEAADAYALKALAAGRASEGQQTRALGFIINTLAASYDLSFRPDSERVTSFAEGRRFVGLQIVKLLNLPPEALQGSPHSG